MERSLSRTVRILHHSSSYRIPVKFKKIPAMFTPLIDDIAASLYLEPLNYKFDFGCWVLNRSTNLGHVNP